jgi:hypothetical protein
MHPPTCTSSPYHNENARLIFRTGRPTCTKVQVAQKSTTFPLSFGWDEHNRIKSVLRFGESYLQVRTLTYKPTLSLERPALMFFASPATLNLFAKIHVKHPSGSGMLINRDYVGFMATELVKKLSEGELVEVKNAAAVTQRIRQAMMDEITVEDRISEEARQILTQHQDQMRSTGVSYQEMFKKVKSQLARDRKLVLR